MITKKEKGEIDIRWGSGAGMQDPNFEDLDYPNLNIFISHPSILESGEKIRSDGL